MPRLAAEMPIAPRTSQNASGLISNKAETPANWCVLDGPFFRYAFAVRFFGMDKNKERIKKKIADAAQSYSTSISGERPAQSGIKRPTGWYKKRYIGASPTDHPIRDRGRRTPRDVIVTTAKPERGWWME